MYLAVFGSANFKFKLHKLFKVFFQFSEWALQHITSNVIIFKRYSLKGNFASENAEYLVTFTKISK